MIVLCRSKVTRLARWAVFRCAQLTVRLCQSLGAENFSRAGPRLHSGVPQGGRPPSEKVEEISASRSVTPQWTSGAKGPPHGLVSPLPSPRLLLILCQSETSKAAAHEADLSAASFLIANTAALYSNEIKKVSRWHGERLLRCGGEKMLHAPMLTTCCYGNGFQSCRLQDSCYF